MKWSFDTVIEVFLIFGSWLGFHKTFVNFQSTTSKILTIAKCSLDSS